MELCWTILTKQKILHQQWDLSPSFFLDCPIAWSRCKWSPDTSWCCPATNFVFYSAHFMCVMCTNILEVDKSLRPLEISIPGYQGLVVDIRRLHYLYSTCLGASIPPSCYSHNSVFWIASLGLSSPKKHISKRTNFHFWIYLERVSKWENSLSWSLRLMTIVENSFCASTSNYNKMECYLRILST
jgi:hypothetical protein